MEGFAGEPRARSRRSGPTPPPREHRMARRTVVDDEDGVPVAVVTRSAGRSGSRKSAKHRREAQAAPEKPEEEESGSGSSAESGSESGSGSESETSKSTSSTSSSSAAASTAPPPAATVTSSSSSSLTSTSSAAAVAAPTSSAPSTSTRSTFSTAISTPAATPSASPSIITTPVSSSPSSSSSSTPATLESQIQSSSVPLSSSSTADAASTGQAQIDNGSKLTENKGSNSDNGGMTPAADAGIALAVIGVLAALGFIAFYFLRKQRQRKRQEAADNDQAAFPPLGPKSDIRIMDAALSAAFAAEASGGRGATNTNTAAAAPRDFYSDEKEAILQQQSSWSDGSSSSSRYSQGPQQQQQQQQQQAPPNNWLRRQVSKVVPRAPPPPARNPKDERVNRWMDRHEAASAMLDPNEARASMVSAVPSGLGPPPSESPASVVPDRRESVLSDMARIRRDAVPPPLDLGMVERVRGEQERREQREYLQPTPPPAAWINGGQGGGKSVVTESTWNTWGVEQHPKR